MRHTVWHQLFHMTTHWITLFKTDGGVTFRDYCNKCKTYIGPVYKRG